MSQVLHQHNFKKIAKNAEKFQNFIENKIGKNAIISKVFAKVLSLQLIKNTIRVHCKYTYKPTKKCSSYLGCFAQKSQK